MTTFPTLFVSHGAPNLLLHESPARDFLAGFCQTLVDRGLGRPQAILVASAHFEMAVPSVCADEKPGLIYDFKGFEEELYKIDYPAPGLPGLATIAADLIEQSGFPAQEIVGRGLDHGVWVPLKLIFPEADIPVVQMAVQPDQGAGHHIALGRALAPLRKHGVLIIGSGSLTHNLKEVLQGGRVVDAPVLDWVQDFEDWILTKAEAGAIDEIADYRSLAPHARENHPTEEHFLPFAFAFGAAGEGAKGARAHHSVQYGAMAMDAYLFE
ncbi:DODA-type extradiol aromatic ring-opening family dioxygenase [Methylocapsa acidiphila]|uniref:DODA-type extradiol aromatic ring-opening family dioxygenase n=1 Tax=Methylocapsa acidiphila TaxID=133552 RepID=UPI0003FA2F84|nr:class III extradiol ring-cleavage dioxygenase [Methylocapsa acidiphila]